MGVDPGFGAGRERHALSRETHIMSERLVEEVFS
jgi:hypothetical protein